MRNRREMATLVRVHWVRQRGSSVRTESASEYRAVRYTAESKRGRPRPPRTSTNALGRTRKRVLRPKGNNTCLASFVTLTDKKKNHPAYFVPGNPKLPKQSIVPIFYYIKINLVVVAIFCEISGVLVKKRNTWDYIHNHG